MKKKLLLLSLIFSWTVGLRAADFTAVSSGNWSSSATWGGVTPGSVLSLDNINIPGGITVTLDQNLTFNGIVNNFTVNGTLTGAYTIVFGEGTLAGSGTININKLVLNSALTTINFNGDLDVDILTVSGAAAVITGDIDVEDSLNLETGTLTISTGGNLTMIQGAVVRRNDGVLLVSGGVLNNNNGYHVVYVGDSKSAGVELNSNFVQDVYINLTDNTETFTLTNDVDIDGVLYLSSGTLVVANNMLTLFGNMVIGSGASLLTSSSSNLTITSGSFTGSLVFASGSSLNNLVINQSGNGVIMLKSTLTIGGKLMLMMGRLYVESGVNLNLNPNATIYLAGGSLIRNGGTFSATSIYNVEYNGGNDTTGWELWGTGLNNVTVNLSSPGAWVILDSNVVVGGSLYLQTGKLHLNGHSLVLNNNLMYGTGMFGGNSSSELYLNMSSSTADSLWFDGTANELSKLSINISSGGTIWLGSDLIIHNELNLASGKFDIANNNLTLQSSVTISQYSDARYIITSGNGMLQMQVTANGPHVVYPIGTSVGYSPAYIQQNASGSSGNFRVRVMSGVYADGSTGTNLASSRSAVNRTWLIESTANVNMNLKLGWLASAEVNGFNRNNAYLAHYINGGWDASAFGAAVQGAFSTYEMTRANITALSPFAIGDQGTGLHTAGLETVSGNKELSIYPNPAAGHISIGANMPGDNYSVEITNQTGQLVMRKRMNGSSTLDVSMLAAGLYFIKAIDDNTFQSFSGKFMKD